MTVQGDSARAGAQPHRPELPRVYLDTRMPPAPAPGGRVIRVAAPSARPRRADLTIGWIALGVIVAVALLFRWARHRRPG